MIAAALTVDGVGHLDAESITKIVAIGGMLAIIIVAIIADAWRKSSQAKAKEESRREIAAYVAEGSMTAEDGAKLLNDRKHSCGWSWGARQKA